MRSSSIEFKLHYNSIRIIRRALYTVFVFLPCNGNRKLQRYFSALLDYIVLLSLLYIICNDMFFAFRHHSMPLGFILSGLSGNLCSIGIRITLMKKRKFILRAIRQIITVHRVEYCKTEGTYLFIAFCGCWVVPCFFYMSSAKNLNQNGSEMFQRGAFFGTYNSNNNWATFLALFLVFLTSQQLYALPGCCIVLCYYTCKLLTKSIKDIESKIKKNTDLKKLFNSYKEQTQKLSKCLEGVEAALSFLLFLLYWYLISCIFIVSTILVQLWQIKDASSMSMNLVLITFLLISFYWLSFKASSIQKSADSLRKTVYRCCAKLFFQMQDGNTQILLLTMLDEFQEKTRITVWGFFALNDEFILQTSSAIISYGVIIVQLGTVT